MNTILTAAHIRGVECDVEAIHQTDEQGAFSVITVTIVETGEPLFQDDDVIDGHLTQADLVRFAGQYAKYGQILDEEFETKALGEVIPFPSTTTPADVAA